jgi:hypothetical protein
VRVIVDNQNAAHHGLLAVAERLRVIDCTFLLRDSVPDSYFRRKWGGLSARQGA